MELLAIYSWPGNIRKLQSAIKQSLLKASGCVLLPEFLPDGIQNLVVKQHPMTDAIKGFFADLDEFFSERIAAGSTTIYEECMQSLEKRLFTAVLKHTQGNLSQASRLLGIHRRTLRGKLHGFGLATPADETSGD